jgi:tetratricopeptide (TPR) repeat protein
MDEADQVSDEQLWLRLAGAEPGERAEITLELAERAAGQDDHERTVTLAKAAAEAAEGAASTSAQARATYLAADAHAELGRNEEALAGYQAAATLYRAVLDEECVAICHFRAGWALSAGGRLDEALEQWETAERLFAGQPNCDDEVGKCALARGGALQRLGRPEEALEALSQSRDAFRRYGEPTQTTWADDQAAGVLLRMGRSGQAVGWLEQCEFVAEAVGDPYRLAYARLRLGVALRTDGRLSAARRSIRRARRGFRQQGSLADVAQCDRETAVCLAMQGRADKARRRFDRARAVFDAAGDDPSVRGIDMDTGILLWDLGRHEESVQVSRRALDAAVSAEDAWGAFGLATRLAAALLDLGRAEEAAEVMTACPDLPVGIGVEERALNLAARARLENVAGDPATAVGRADEGLALVDGTTLTMVQAVLYAARAEVTQTSDPVAAAADRARSAALFLAAGEPGHAAEVSRPFLPPAALD